jgi:hypothetical protein
MRGTMRGVPRVGRSGSRVGRKVFSAWALVGTRATPRGGPGAGRVDLHAWRGAWARGRCGRSCAAAGAVECFTGTRGAPCEVSGEAAA